MGKSKETDQTTRAPQAEWAQQWEENRDMWLLQPNDRELGPGVGGAAKTIAGALRAPSIIDRIKIATAKGDRVWLAVGFIAFITIVNNIIINIDNINYATFFRDIVFDITTSATIFATGVVIMAAVALLREYDGPVRGTHSLTVVAATDGRQPLMAYHADRAADSVMRALGKMYGRAADLHSERLSYANLTGLPAERLVERSGQVGQVMMEEKKPTDVLRKGPTAEEIIRDGEQHLPLGGIVEIVAESNVPMLLQITVTPQHATGNLETRAKRADKGITAWPAVLGHWLISKMGDDATDDRNDYQSPRAKAIADTTEVLFDTNVRFFIGHHTKDLNLAPTLAPVFNKGVTPYQQTADLPADPDRWHRYQMGLRSLRHKTINPYAIRERIATQAATATPPTRLLRTTGIGVYRSNYTTDHQEMPSLVLAPTDDEGLNRQLAVRPPAERPGPGPNDRRQEDLRGREP